MVRVAEHQELDADEGSPLEIERLSGLLDGAAAGPPPRGPLVSARRSIVGSGRSTRSATTWSGSPSSASKVVRSDRVARARLGEARAEDVRGRAARATRPAMVML